VCFKDTGSQKITERNTRFLADSFNGFALVLDDDTRTDKMHVRVGIENLDLTADLARLPNIVIVTERDRTR